MMMTMIRMMVSLGVSEKESPEGFYSSPLILITFSSDEGSDQRRERNSQEEEEVNRHGTLQEEMKRKGISGIGCREARVVFNPGLVLLKLRIKSFPLENFSYGIESDERTESIRDHQITSSFSLFFIWNHLHPF